MSRSLLAGLVLAVASLSYVLYPVFASRARHAGAPTGDGSSTRAVTDEEIEAAIRAYRESRVAGRVACAACGPRPEPDALFCSTCGRRLEPTGA